MEEKIVMRPLDEQEQKKLMERSENALIALEAWRKCMEEDGKEKSEMERMLQSAINIFTELRNQWAIAIGQPQEIKGATLQKILDAALRILRQELKNGTL